MGLSKTQGGIGFHNLVSFNNALLAKQCWRLLKNPDNLVVRILQAKYFPRGIILQAPLGKRPSFSWRSIQRASTLLQQGLIWKIGDGSNVKI